MEGWPGGGVAHSSLLLAWVGTSTDRRVARGGWPGACPERSRRVRALLLGANPGL